jgi:hypothetical protein
MRGDVQEIFKKTPHEKQVMMFSATLSQDIRPVCKKFMANVRSAPVGGAHRRGARRGPRAAAQRRGTGGGRWRAAGAAVQFPWGGGSHGTRRAVAAASSSAA